VIERNRKKLEGNDGLLWFCDSCNEKLHEVYFPLNDVETDFFKHFKDFYDSEDLRTCNNCSGVMEVDKRFTN
jgi:3-hydroxyanthranilate 3,4-dioxygenase